jgi:hypothetical protein
MLSHRSQRKNFLILGDMPHGASDVGVVAPVSMAGLALHRRFHIGRPYYRPGCYLWVNGPAAETYALQRSTSLD